MFCPFPSIMSDIKAHADITIFPPLQLEMEINFIFEMCMYDIHRYVRY